jgi:hypothetical protein
MPLFSATAMSHAKHHSYAMYVSNVAHFHKPAFEHYQMQTLRQLFGGPAAPQVCYSRGKAISLAAKSGSMKFLYAFWFGYSRQCQHRDCKRHNLACKCIHTSSHVQMYRVHRPHRPHTCSTEPIPADVCMCMPEHTWELSCRHGAHQQYSSIARQSDVAVAKISLGSP